MAELISNPAPSRPGRSSRPCPGPRPVSLAGLVEAREVINHRAINNRYFSSNVYRVRFKRLVKTNLRPRALFAPLGPPHPDTRWTTRATGIYHGRKLRDLARNLSAPMEKVGGESASLPRAPFVGSCESNEPRLAPSRFPRPIRPADLFARPSPASPFIPRRVQNPSPPTSYNKLWKRVVAACSLLPERGEKTTRWCRVE